MNDWDTEELYLVECEGDQRTILAKWFDTAAKGDGPGGKGLLVHLNGRQAYGLLRDFGIPAAPFRPVP
jgi:hypothetical protein